MGPTWGERRLSNNVELEASAPRRQLLPSRAIRSEKLTLVLLEAVCLAVIAVWIALIVLIWWALL